MPLPVGPPQPRYDQLGKPLTPPNSTERPGDPTASRPASQGRSHRRTPGQEDNMMTQLLGALTDEQDASAGRPRTRAAHPGAATLYRSFVAGVVVFGILAVLFYLTSVADRPPVHAEDAVKASFGNVHSLRVNERRAGEQPADGRVSEQSIAGNEH